MRPAGSALGAVWLVIAGCAEPAVVQRMELIEPAMPAPRSEPEPLAREAMDPLAEGVPGALVEGVGLVEPADIGRGYVVVEPPDLSTGVGLTSPMLTFGPDAGEVEELVRREPRRARLVTYPEGAAVESHLTDGSSGYGDTTRRLVLEPTRPLESRWYAVEVDLPDPPLGVVRFEDRFISRFRPDSHPIVQSVLSTPRDARWLIELRFSERVAGLGPSSRWTVVDSDGDLGCMVTGPEPGREELHAVLSCARSQRGRVHVDFGGVLTTVLGTEVRDAHGVALTALDWAVREPDPDRAISRTAVFDL